MAASSAEELGKWSGGEVYDVHVRVCYACVCVFVGGIFVTKHTNGQHACHADTAATIARLTFTSRLAGTCTVTPSRCVGMAVQDDMGTYRPPARG